MMKNKVSFLSMFCALCSVLCALPCDAAIRIGNQTRSNAAAYQQLSTMGQPPQAYYADTQQPAAAVKTLPVVVNNAELADKILAGDTSAGVGMSNLESCAMIYPNGEFAWDKPTAGTKAGGSATCVAVVEMRVLRGTDDIIVARANIAAGDAIDCNISKFPESSYLPDAYSVEFPADKAPTVDDVKRVMNDEQKKYAGFKIAAGTVVGGLLGNASSKSEVGSSSLIGGKQSGTGTVVGALSGAAIMAGSSYAGKVAGDMILSGGVNAAAGAVVGNMVANGESVLRVEKCEDLTGRETSCLWGVIQKSDALPAESVGFYNISNGKTMVCKTDGLGECTPENIIGFSLPDESGKVVYKSVEEGISDQNFLKLYQNINAHYTFDQTQRQMTAGTSGDDKWLKVIGGGRPTQRISAMVPDFRDKTFGMKMKDWYKWRTGNSSVKPIGRNARGEPTQLPTGEWTLSDFYPLTLDADDGSMIDINNKARLKGTLVGAGSGAGLGAFTAYQGATDEIQERWVASVTEYKDSLQKVYCGTGKRFLSSYNDIAVIPNTQ